MFSLVSGEKVGDSSSGSFFPCVIVREVSKSYSVKKDFIGGIGGLRNG